MASFALDAAAATSRQRIPSRYGTGASAGESSADTADAEWLHLNPFRLHESLIAICSKNVHHFTGFRTTRNRTAYLTTWRPDQRSSWPRQSMIHMGAACPAISTKPLNTTLKDRRRLLATQGPSSSIHCLTKSTPTVTLRRKKPPSNHSAACVSTNSFHQGPIDVPLAG